MPKSTFPERKPTFRKVFLITAEVMAARSRPLLIAVLSFTLLSAVVAAFTDVRVQKVEDRLAADAGVSWVELTKVVNGRLANMTETGALRIAAGVRMQKLGQVPSINSGSLAMLDREEAMVIAYIAGIAPWSSLSFALIGAIFFVAGTFFLTLAVAGRQSAYEVSKRLPKSIFSMIGLCFWVLVRSFIWIPFIGLLIAVYMLPRLSLSPVLFIGGANGIMKSAGASMLRTRGKWFTVFVSFLGAAAVGILILWVGLSVVSVLAIFSSKAAWLLWMFSLFFAVAFEAFFWTMFTVTLE